MRCGNCRLCGQASDYRPTTDPGGAPGPLEWGDKCGVYAIYAPGYDAARLIYFGLYALQHRGQENAGIAVAQQDEIDCHTGTGLASQVFDEEIIEGLQGNVALGHVRYSTTGSSRGANAQPLVGEHRSGPFALAHNGNLVNTAQLHQELAEQGVQFTSTTDSEVILRLIERSGAETLEEAIAEAMHQMRGAYSLGILAPGRVIAVRDPNGVRPLAIGRLDSNGWIISSETCGLPVVGGKFVREVEPGEMVTLGPSGMDSVQVIDPERKAVCIFEFIYFARPDSHIYGRNVYMTRRRMGNLLAAQAPVDADMVIPVPESGIPHAVGYAEVSKIPYGEGFIKNRYIHRTFINPDQRLRELGVRIKLTPLREVIAGKRLVVVDDSIVRGTTTGPEIDLLREAGAREVHLRINCPPIRYPCFYGIDTSGQGELIAARMSVEEVRAHLGADSLEHLNMPNLVKAVGLPKNNFCTACFDAQYPIAIPKDIKLSKSLLEPEHVEQV